MFVKTQRDITTWLERISVKGGMDKDSWKSPEAAIFRFATLNFIEERAHGKALDLYRYKVELKTLPADALPTALALTGRWFAAQASEQKRLPNVQEPSKPKSEGSYENDARQLFGLAAWAYGADAKRDLATMRKVSDLFDPYYARLKMDGKGGLALAEAKPQGLETLLIAADMVNSSGLLPDRRAKAAAFFETLKGLLKDGFPKDQADGTVLPDLPNYAAAVLLRLAAQSRRDADKTFAREFAEENVDLGPQQQPAGGGRRRRDSERRGLDQARRGGDRQMGPAADQGRAGRVQRPHRGLFASRNCRPPWASPCRWPPWLAPTNSSS